MFKKRCRVCGARNSKERMTCAECGSLLNFEQIAPSPGPNSAGIKAPVATETGRKVQEEQPEPEKVGFKKDGQAGYDPRNLQKAVIRISDEILIIELDEALKIPLSQIEEVNLNPQSHFYYISAAQPLTITYIDHKNKKQQLFIRVENNLEIDLQTTIHRQMIGKYFKTDLLHTGDKSPGNFLVRVKESFRDKTRDDFCLRLQTLGIKAKMVARGRFEEDITDMDLELSGYSLGVIAIDEDPIRWINIRKIGNTEGQDNPFYYIDYGIVDTKLTPDSPYRTYYNVNSIWQGRDQGTGILESLNNDPGLKEPFLEDVRIVSLSEYGCWIISKKTVSTNWKTAIPLVEPVTELVSRDREPQNTNLVPGTAEWKCYQTIAQYLTAGSPDQGGIANFTGTDHFQ